MSIEDRIAEILRTHFWIEHLEGCACGEGHYRWDYGESHYIAHVARVIVTELELKSEYCARHESGGGQITTTYAAALKELQRPPRPPGVDDPGSGRYTHVERRYVTPWENT